MFACFRLLNSDSSTGVPNSCNQGQYLFPKRQETRNNYQTVCITISFYFWQTQQIRRNCKKICVEDRRAIERSQISRISKKENETKFQWSIINERRSITQRWWNRMKNRRCGQTRRRNFFWKAFRILGLDETRGSWLVEPDFHGNFQVNVTLFLPFSPVSLTELCSFWYDLKDLFTLPK